MLCVYKLYPPRANGKDTDCTEPWSKGKEVFAKILGTIPPCLIDFISLQRPGKTLWHLSAVHELAEIKMTECFRRCSKRNPVISVTLGLHLVKAHTGTEFCLAGKVYRNTEHCGNAQ